MRSKVVSVLFLFSAASTAAGWSPEELKCSGNVYCVSDMVCVGQVVDRPSGMHPSHYTSVIRLKALKSVKNIKGGKKVLVDTLGLGNESVGARPDLSVQAAREMDLDLYWFGPPARRTGDEVKTPMTTTGFSEGLSFVVTEIIKGQGYETHRLAGTERVKGSVVGDYQINYECEAIVGAQAADVIDQTK